MAGITRQRQILFAGAAAVFAATFGGLLIGIVPLYLPRVMASALAAIVLIGVLLATLPRWRRLDHMQRDSRLASWYWGGSFGGSLGLVLAIIFAGVRSPLFAGAALVWLLQFTGYAVARFKWWLAYRSEAP